MVGVLALPNLPPPMSLLIFISFFCIQAAETGSGKTGVCITLTHLTFFFLMRSSLCFFVLFVLGILSPGYPDCARGASGK